MFSTILLHIVNSPVDSLSKAVANMPMVPQPTQASLSLFDLLMKGGWVMVPIAILLFLAIYIFIERLLAISRTPKAEDNFIHNIKDMLASGNIDAAKTLVLHTKGPQAAIVGKGIHRLGKPISEIEEAMQAVAQQELYRLEKNISILSIIGRVP